MRVAVEYDGRNWHRASLEIEKKKYSICQNIGISLIRIREAMPDCDPACICDHLIISKYGDSKKLEDLDASIKELLYYLQLSCEVNTQNDQITIRSQYYNNLKSKSLQIQFPEISKELKPIYLIRQYLTAVMVSL